MLGTSLFISNLIWHLGQPNNLMVYGCGCVLVENPSHFMTSTKMRFLWLLLSTMNCNREPFTHIWVYSASIVALSTTEAEYMVATHASKEAVWLQRSCSGIGLVQQEVRLDCDSQSAIFLEKNPAYHLKTKHIDVQYHFVRDMVEEKKVLLEKVDTLKNVADSLTKSVSKKSFTGIEQQWALLPWIVDYIIPWIPGCKENNKWENVG
jgi:phosphoribosyl-AMP cyclohydrolase